MDHVSVVYYDDPMFERLTDKTRCCNSTREYCCGGEGERVRIDASCLGGLCIRGSFPFCFIPCCVPECMAPCALQHNIMVKSKTEKWGGAKEAIKILQGEPGFGSGPGFGLEFGLEFGFGVRVRVRGRRGAHRARRPWPPWRRPRRPG